ncbi:hypothetical protein ACLB2K_012867 [Fragaria x ananassa]
MQDWLSLEHVCVHIDKVINPQPPELIQQNQLWLKATIEVVRLIAKQTLAFRGDDESVESSNRGNIIETVDSYGRMNEEVAKVTLANALGNTSYTSPKIQKEILSILANKFRRKIREEVGDAKFSILLDEALDEGKNEQMTIILRFVDSQGIINVVDSSAKRVFELKYIQEAEVVEQIVGGELETGKGAKSAKSASYSVEIMKTMGITNALCKSLQEQSQEITNAMNLVASTKGHLEKLREDGWVDFFANVVSFCVTHTIVALDFSAPHLVDLMTVYIERDIVDTIDSTSFLFSY